MREKETLRRFYGEGKNSGKKKETSADP